MNILVSVDKNYILPLQVTLRSLFENSKDEEHVIYFLYSGLDDKSINSICRFIQNAKHQCVTIEANESVICKLPSQWNHVTSIAYLRCFAFDFLPKDLERILYLDADIIINGDLSEFYYSDFDNNFFIAVRNKTTFKMDNHKRLNIPQDRTYFNSGVLLYNLKKLQDEFDINRINEWIEKYRDKIKYHDQDILNAVFYDNVKIVEGYKYNWQVRASKGNNDFYDAVVIHYTSSHKPWKFGYCLGYGKEYWKYAKSTPMKKLWIIQVINALLAPFLKLILHIFEKMVRKNPRIC